MDAVETRSDPADLTFERFRAALESDASSRYPKGALFVDAEAPFAAAALMRNMREDLPVVLVYPDGVEKIIAPGAPSERRSFGVAFFRGVRSKLLSLF